MNKAPTKVPCSACGRLVERDDMYGLPPDLVCPTCSDARRQRMATKVRPQMPKPSPPIVTIVSLGLCVLLFIATDMIFKTNRWSRMPGWLEALHQREAIWTGEFWRHIGSVFLHGGPMHLLMNGMTIWSIGRIVEAFWGHFTMALLILATGVSSMAAQWIMSGPAVGISGALFGLCGFLWALSNFHHPVAQQVMNKRMRNWIISMSLLFVVLSYMGSLRIANTAHGVGFLTGYLLGALEGLRVPKWLRTTILIAVTIALVVAAQFVALGSRDYGNGHNVKRSEIRKQHLRRR